METKKNITRRFVVLIAFVFLFLIPQDLFSQGPPPWAPAHGYRAKTRHIYFPDHNVYFDLQARTYFYFRNGSWSVSARIPSIYAQVNFGTSRQIELDFYQDRPYRYNSVHVVKYKGKKPHHTKKHKGHHPPHGKGKRDHKKRN